MRPMRRRTEAPLADKGGSTRRPSGGRGTHRGKPRWGPPRGGRTSQIHAAANQAGKPIAFHLSGGNTADLRGGETPIEAVPEGALVIADCCCPPKIGQVRFS